MQKTQLLIIGGRQSAYEWAALINEQGGKEIHISHRHALPKFEESNWTWTRDLVQATAQNPGWFRRLSSDEHETIRQRFWAEGRLKLEPWLGPRIIKDNIHLWPGTTLVECKDLADGQMRIKLDNGATFEVDHLILATGYRVNVSQVPYLSRDGNFNCTHTMSRSRTASWLRRHRLPGRHAESFANEIYFSGVSICFLAKRNLLLEP